LDDRNFDVATLRERFHLAHILYFFAVFMRGNSSSFMHLPHTPTFCATTFVCSECPHKMFKTFAVANISYRKCIF